MKKIFFVAIVVVSGLTMVSCDTEAIEGSTPQSKENNTISFANSNSTNASDNGPGNDIIIITPPKNPKL